MLARASLSRATVTSGFIHHRELLGELSRCAYETLIELMTAATFEEEGVRSRGKWKERTRGVSVSAGAFADGSEKALDEEQDVAHDGVSR